MGAANSKSVGLGNNYNLQAYFSQGDRYTAKNYSKVYVEAKLSATNTNWSSSYASYLRVYWHDNRENYDRLVAEIPLYGCDQWTDYYASGTIDVYHNNDGNLSGYAYATFTKGGTSSYAPSTGGVATDLTALWSISRYAVTDSATGDDIEGIFKVKYTKYVSTYKYKLRISVPSVTMLERIDYNTSEEEISLSQTTINSLFNTFSDTNVFNLGFAIETWSSDGLTKLSDGNGKIIECCITDANPEFDDFDYEEIKTTSLTGNTGKIIRGYSDIRITITAGNKAIAAKGASITNYQTTIGSVTKKYDGNIQYPLSYVLENVDGPTIVTSAIDSRGNSRPVLRQTDIIDYTPIEFVDMSVSRINDISEETILTFNGKIDLVDFGAVVNKIKNIQYYYKKVGQDDSYYILGTTQLNPTVDEEGNISINQNIEGDVEGQGFNQNYSYEIKLVIVDELLNIYNDKVEYIEILGTGNPAQAIIGNCTSLGMPYDETIGGRVQINAEGVLVDAEGNSSLIAPYVKVISEPQKTGRIIDGKIEYVKRITTNTSETVVSTGLIVGTHEITKYEGYITDELGTGIKVRDGFWNGNTNYFMLLVNGGVNIQVLIGASTSWASGKSLIIDVYYIDISESEED